MTFLTAQSYENYSYRFYIEDDHSYTVKIFLEDSKKATRHYKDKKEVLEKYGEHFKDLEKPI